MHSYWLSGEGNNIINNGDYFPSNYFGEDFAKQVLLKSGFTKERIHELNGEMQARRDVATASEDAANDADLAVAS